MVLSVLVALIAAPALLGSQEAIRDGQKQAKREEHRSRRCNLIASCVKSSVRSRELNGRPIVLRKGKLYIDTGTTIGEQFGHQYAGYYLPYPDTNYEGIVTTITDEAPIMNWVYIDSETHEVKYGVRADAQPNLTGPFDCTRQDRRMTFEGWEGWCAVEEYPTIWALYFDRNDDGLRGKVAKGTRVLEIELQRKEKKFKKEIPERREDQDTSRAVDNSGEAPTETPPQPEQQPVSPGSDPPPAYSERRESMTQAAPFPELNPQHPEGSASAPGQTSQEPNFAPHEGQPKQDAGQPGLTLVQEPPAVSVSYANGTMGSDEEVVNSTTSEFAATDASTAPEPQTPVKSEQQTPLPPTKSPARTTSSSSKLIDAPHPLSQNRTPLTPPKTSMVDVEGVSPTGRTKHTSLTLPPMNAMPLTPPGIRLMNERASEAQQGDESREKKVTLRPSLRERSITNPTPERDTKPDRFSLHKRANTIGVPPIRRMLSKARRFGPEKK